VITLQRIAALIVMMGSTACARGRYSHSEIAAPSQHSAAAPTSKPFLTTLAVPGYEPSLLSVPPPSPLPKPLVVVAHGAGDRPEWQCEVWGNVVAEHAFVLCLRGRRTDSRIPLEQAGYYYPDHRWLRRAIGAALQALSQNYGARVDARSAVFVGYSQGAIMGALLLGTAPPPFAHLCLIEGGGNEWTLERAQSFREQGGQSLVLVCGTGHCRREGRRALAVWRRAGLRSRLVDVPGAGHTYAGAVERILPAALDWLVAEDPVWGRASRSE
jgi:predicted esterase